MTMTRVMMMSKLSAGVWDADCLFFEVLLLVWVYHLTVLA